MNMLPTPGPWFVLPDPAWKGKHPCHDARYVATAPELNTYTFEHFDGTKGWRFEDPKQSIICTLPDAPNQKANATLIAAAPQTLKALKALRAAVQGISGYWTESVDTAMQQADHAIKQATP